MNLAAVYRLKLGKNLSRDNVFFIAEAGVNHNGNIDLAKKLIDTAKRAGADAVKFQTFKGERLASTSASKANYQKETTSGSESQLAMLKSLELSHAQFIELSNYCKQKDILFLSSPFDMESIDFLTKLNMPIFKIPSGEITHLPYLRKVGQLNRPVILSTGMSTLEEVKSAAKTLCQAGLSQKNLSILQCTTEYPCPFAEVNLNAMLTLRKELDLSVGYSDHTPGIAISLAAVAMGATIIEKHFTLDKTLPGPDHQASLEPDELKQLIQEIRHVDYVLWFADGIIAKTTNCSDIG